MYREIVATSYRNEFIKSKEQVYLIAKKPCLRIVLSRFVKFILSMINAFERLIE